MIRAMHPHIAWPVRIDGSPVPANIQFAVLAFAFVYMASINNTGPGMNQVGPATTYEILTDFQT